MHIRLWVVSVFLLQVSLPLQAFGTTDTAAAARIQKDIAEGRPLVAHLTVALCDNEYQGIVPVAGSLCKGDQPNLNLYWGAMYGVKTYFKRHTDWQTLPASRPGNLSPVLERVIFSRNIVQNGRTVKLYLIADAWRGRNIKEAIEYFLQMSGGQHRETLTFGDVTLEAGGAAHLTGFIGHNGLMDFSLTNFTLPGSSRLANSSIILACFSHKYFNPYLDQARSYALLTTNGLMAPEAYTLEAALSTWFATQSPAQTHEAAAAAYSQYQKANIKWTRRLFRSGK